MALEWVLRLTLDITVPVDVLEMSERDKRMTYWGYSFESYVTVDNTVSQTSNSVSPPATAVNNGQQFCSLVRTKLGEHRLLFGGEVDGLNVETNEYIELKTNRNLETNQQRINFHRFKLLKMWLQSFLIGINTIICGYRDEDGIVTNLETVKVSNIPHTTKTYWSGAVCFNFLHDFLSSVKKHVTENDKTKVYKFEYRSKSRKIHFVEVDPTEYCFVRVWFTEGVEKM